MLGNGFRWDGDNHIMLAADLNLSNKEQDDICNYAMAIGYDSYYYLKYKIWVMKHERNKKGGEQCQ